MYLFYLFIFQPTTTNFFVFVCKNFVVLFPSFSLVSEYAATQGLEIGQRVRLKNGHTGTIRHVGAGHWAPGDFVGVELGEYPWIQRNYKKIRLYVNFKKKNYSPFKFVTLHLNSPLYIYTHTHTHVILYHHGHISFISILQILRVVHMTAPSTT
jgi:hypothetical protein